MWASLVGLHRGECGVATHGPTALIAHHGNVFYDEKHRAVELQLLLWPL